MPAISAPTRSSITCGRSGARKSTRPQLGKLKITCPTTVPAPLRRIRALIRLRRLLQRHKPYEDAVLLSSSPDGTPLEALDTAATLYTVGTKPDTEPTKDLRSQPLSRIGVPGG
jgi:hypothetical protein